MKNYENIPVDEAALKQVCEKFVESIKLLDSRVASKRLFCLILNKPISTQLELLCKFLVLVNCKTSADDL